MDDAPGELATPRVRVVDASRAETGGPVEIVCTDVTSSPTRFVDAVATAGGQATSLGGRLHVIAPVPRLIAAAGRASGTDDAARMERLVTSAVAAWSGPPPPLRLGDEEIDVSRVPLVMGIVNVTPDSFSDGGAHADARAAIAHGIALRAAGADVVDVGGESTRPGSDPVSADVELARVVPVVAGLVAAGCRVSIDTTKAAVARAAVGEGAVLVNDISGGRLDDSLLPTVAALDVAYVAMHMRGVPRTMQDAPSYDDATAEVFEELADLVDHVVGLGLDRRRVLVDPGIGFGKRLADNLVLLRDLRQLRSLGCPVLVGASRKRFIGELTGVSEPEERLAGSLAVAALATAAGASVLRVHDVAATREAVRVAHAVITGTPGHAGEDERGD